MKRITTLLMAFIAITTLSLATPGDKLSSHSLMNAFFPNHISGKNYTYSNTIDKLNNINDLNATKQKLDSAITYGEIFQEGMKVDAKMDFVYNENGQVVSGTMKIYSAGTHNQVYEFKNVFEYDQNGRIITNTQTMSNDINFYRTAYTYNTNGTLATETDYMWDEETSAWVIAAKYEYTYNVNKQMISKLIYGYTMSSEISLTGKIEYLYDNETNLSETIEYAWNEDWIKTRTEQYEYDGSDLINITTYTVVTDDIGGEVLVLNSKVSYAYDESNNRYMETNYNTNVGSEELIITSKDVYKYNNDYSATDLVLPFTPSDADMKDYFSHMVVSSMSYVYDSGTLTDSIKAEFYYSQFSGSTIFETHLESAQVSPNPSTEYVSFNWESAEITVDVIFFDINGKELFNETITKGEAVQVGDLRTGTYLYELRASGKILYGGKIVIM